MNEQAYRKLVVQESSPETVERTIQYLAERLRQFLRRRDKVLICFPDEPAAVGGMFKEAVLRCDAEPLFLEGDNRWFTLLKTAFMSRCDAMIGFPLTMLGLAKLAKHYGTPLFARNVLIGGYPSSEWMVRGIETGLDCRVWGCYDPGLSAMIAGFSCPEGFIHLRDDSYRVQILNTAGKPVQPGKKGGVMLSSVKDPDFAFDTGDCARLEETPCSCGCTSPRLTDFSTSNGIDPVISQLWESFHYWGSILDCKIANTGYGLELELVVFPGEKLPKMPSCAKLVVRAWNPETDEPFPHAFMLKKRLFSRENH